MARLLTPFVGLALMALTVMTPVEAPAQTIEYNQHGTLITYPNGEVILWVNQGMPAWIFRTAALSTAHGDG